MKLLLVALFSVALASTALCRSTWLTPVYTAQNVVHTLSNHTYADSTDLTQFAGTYSFSAGSPASQVTITVEKGELYGEIDGYGRNKILKQNEDHIFKSTSSYGTMYIFNREMDKTISSVLIQVMGQELTAQKDKK